MTRGDAHPAPAVFPYGGWPSSIDAGTVAAGAGTLSELRACGGSLFWLESRPHERGRVTLLRADADGARELTPAPASIRSRVHEYGGGSYLPTAEGVFFVDDRDGEIHWLQPDGAALVLTACAARVRFADFALDPSRRRLLAVCERPGQAEPENLLVAVPLDGGPVGADALVPIHRGHDFYAAPRVAPDGARLAFVAWDHPNMPWDGTLLKLLIFAGDDGFAQELLVAGSAAEAVQQPLWTPDGALLFLSDLNGYWNVYRYDPSGVFCVLEDGAEYAEAPWALGQSTLAALGPDWLAAIRFGAGSGELVLVDTLRGFASPLPAEWIEYESLCPTDGGLAFIGRSAEGPPAVVVRRLADGAETILARAALPRLDATRIARAEPREFRTRDGARIHGLLYRPLNPDCRAPNDLRPPLLVTVHGGPTGRASAALNLRVQFFTSRGWAVLEVDYRGSTGYGRRYREALNGRWGELDAADCEDAARSLVHEGIVDADRIAIRGSSAGGLTVLAALSRSTLFGAGTSLYGVADLEAMTHDSHKFESRYIATLVGEPAAAAARSPVHRAQLIGSPVLFLQGSEDPVVPPVQAAAMAAALRARRVPVAHVEFAGEGHGFRQAANIERALQYEYAFYCRVFRIESASPLPPLEIESP
jgi:acetyl esterase/lipase